MDLSYLSDVEEKESHRFAIFDYLHHFKELSRYILKHPLPLSFGLGMVVLATIGTLLEPRIFGYAIDEGIVPKDWVRLQQCVVIFFLVVCLRAIGTILQGYAFELLGQKVTQDLRCRLFAHVQSLPLAQFDKNPAGRFLTRVTNDVASLTEMFSAGFLSLVSNLLIVIGILVWLLVLDFRLGLIASSVFPVLCLLTVLFSSWLKKAYHETRNRLSSLNAFLAENLLGIKVTQLFNRQHTQQMKFESINEWYTQAQIGTVRVFAFFQPSITWAAGLSMALIIWFGGVEADRGQIRLGVLVAFFSYVLSLFQPMREIADKWNVFLSGMASAERIFSILRWNTEENDPMSILKQNPLKDRLQGHIEFNNVWFAYNGENWVLKDVSFSIPAGSTVGVVGYTGAGKTTLMSLLLRFYEPQKGSITIDGVNLLDFDKRVLRSMIGIVQQDVFIFSGSFRDNITLWNNPIEEDQRQQGVVLSVLDSLHCKDWWQGPSSQNHLEERGVNLSLGQRQVLAYVRALAKNPKLWILDEATANIDTQTEKILQKMLKTHSHGKTLLVIAHRISTIRNADLILVFHQGHLVQSGKHEELFHAGGIYSKMVQFQNSADRNIPEVSL